MIKGGPARASPSTATRPSWLHGAASSRSAASLGDKAHRLHGRAASVSRRQRREPRPAAVRAGETTGAPRPAAASTPPASSHATPSSASRTGNAVRAALPRRHARSARAGRRRRARSRSLPRSDYEVTRRRPRLLVLEAGGPVPQPGGGARGDQLPGHRRWSFIVLCGLHVGLLLVRRPQLRAALAAGLRIASRIARQGCADEATVTRLVCTRLRPVAALAPLLRSGRRAPQRQTLGGDPVPRLAYYYIWFNPTSWKRAKTDYPLLGRYSSDEQEVMRKHIRLGEAGRHQRLHRLAGRAPPS